jgi:hypothetical protein
MSGHQVRSYGASVTTENRSTDTAGGAAFGHTGTPHYEVRVSGHLGSRWTAWFDGLSVTDEGDGTAVIRGPVVDQAALHGLLQKLRDLGIPLVSLTRLPLDAAPAPGAPRTQGGN